MFTLPDNVKVLNLPEQVEKNREDIASISSRVTSVSVHASDIGQQVKLHDADIEKLKTAVTDIDSGAINTHYLSVHGPADVSDKLRVGKDVEVGGNIILNSADDIVDGNGNKLIASVQLDEFKKNYYATAGKFRFAGIHINEYEGEGTNGEIIDPESTKWTDLTQMYSGSGYYAFGNLVTDRPIRFPDFYSGTNADTITAYGLIDGFENPMVEFGNATLNGMRLFEHYEGKSITVAEGKKFQLYGYAAAIFNDDQNLEEIGELDLSQVSSLEVAFSDCGNLLHIHCKHFPVSFDIHGSTKLSQEALVEIISNLDPVSTAQTLTMGATNLAKLTQDQILVATGKGWTLA